VPFAAAVARAAQQQRHAEGDQENRSDEVERADREQAQVLGEAQRADDDEGDGEDSHDVLRVEVRR
jgi:hypothetical protein